MPISSAEHKRLTRAMEDALDESTPILETLIGERDALLKEMEPLLARKRDLDARMFAAKEKHHRLSLEHAALSKETA